MAYVAISGALRSSVMRNINTMRDKELELFFSAAVSPERVNVIEDWHLEMAWGEHLPLKQVIPQEWCVMQADVHITTEDENSDRVTFKLIFDPKLPTPPKSEPYAFRATLARTHPFVAPRLEAHKRRLAVKKRWEKVKDDVGTFLGQCKSLNEALKLWPDLRVYIDQSDLNRVESKVVRSKTSDALETLKKIDTDAAISSAVLARLAAATPKTEGA